ncbi:MAG TPA: DUF5330 domain-containing protein [Pseudolabrys sp.]|nr:DUF5330 domain-containing protein [Pseudolabrys sp.]
MLFLLRMAFWLGVVCLLLPGSGSQSKTPTAQIDAAEAVTLAGAAVSDARGFCDRQPAACQIGGKVAVALGHRAEAGARTLYQFIAAKLSGQPAPAKDSIAQAMPVSLQENGTLTAADLHAPWHAPVPLPPRREARTGRPAA